MIRELIVANLSGLHLYRRKFTTCYYEEETEPSLFCAFVIAIVNFGQTITGQYIKQIEFENVKILFFIKPSHNLVFVITTDDLNNDQNKRILRQVADIFIQNYSDILEENSRVIKKAQFEGFDKILVQYDLIKDGCLHDTVCEACPFHKSRNHFGSIINFLKEHNFPGHFLKNKRTSKSRV